ncbi:MAG: polyprenyl synthetase family protein [Candidatus Hydrogenedentes bacterium]|nr:polyprenyl synthetase family protein [Candidatus Hydrogenedentota bacterium]
MDSLSVQPLACRGVPKEDCMVEFDLASYLTERKALVEQALEDRLPSADTEPKRVHEAMRYATLDGGKRLRPIVALAVADIGCVPPVNVLDAACAVEFVHTASLILDDLPAMDNAPHRRGKPCTHHLYGEATAILASFGLISSAFDLVTRNAECLHGNEATADVVRILSEVLGTTGIIHGQHIDLMLHDLNPTLEELEQIYIQKASALFLASIAIPGRLAALKKDELDRLERYALNLGLAFQITDDLLDAEAPDENKAKATFSTYLGVEGARERARDLLHLAMESLDPFGDRAEPLRMLAAYVGSRTF